MWISKTIVCSNIVRMPLLEKTWLAMFSRLTAAKCHFVWYFLFSYNDQNQFCWGRLLLLKMWIMFSKSVFMPHYFNDSNFAIQRRYFSFLLYFDKCTYDHSRIKHGSTFNIHEKICYIDIIISLAAIKFYGTCVVSTYSRLIISFCKHV